MRWVSSILLIVGMASPALAADYDIPILRGSQPPAPVVTVGPATFTRWSGFYVGGDFSFNNSSAEFSSATQPLFADSFRDLTLEEQAHPSQIQVLGKGTSNAFGGGGFVGYNTQWQDWWHRSLGIAFASEFQPDCRGCVRGLCTPTCAQMG